MKTTILNLMLILLVLFFLASCKTQKYGCYDFSESSKTEDVTGVNC